MLVLAGTGIPHDANFACKRGFLDRIRLLGGVNYAACRRSTVSPTWW